MAWPWIGAVRAPLRKAVRWTLSLAFTAFLFALVAAAAAPVLTWAFGGIVAATLACAGTLYLALPGNRMFLVTFGNLVAVYACIYALYLEVSFPHVPAWLTAPGFVLPIAAFVAGTVLRRDRVRRIVEGHIRLAGAAEGPPEEAPLSSWLLWLLPLVLIGLLALIVPGLQESDLVRSILFAVAMLAIALLALLVSHQVAAFLVETSLLLADLFARFARLARAIYAFVSFYSLIVIAFAALYRVIDRFAAAPQFIVDQAPARIDFADALYFSIVTLSTVGYGDIVPATGAVQLLVAVEVVLGLLLLLFGVSEIIGAVRRPPPD